MGLTDENLIFEKPYHHPFAGGVQRLYRFRDGHGLLAVNGSNLNSYPFAWEIAVLQNVQEDGTFEKFDYSTPLTEDGEVFGSDAETNAFIAKAKHLFDRRRRRRRNDANRQDS